MIRRKIQPSCTFSSRLLQVHSASAFSVLILDHEITKTQSYFLRQLISTTKRMRFQSIVCLICSIQFYQCSSIRPLSHLGLLVSDPPVRRTHQRTVSSYEVPLNTNKTRTQDSPTSQHQHITSQVYSVSSVTVAGPVINSGSDAAIANASRDCLEMLGRERRM